jgi:protein-tyrosine phosphatase
MVEKEDMKHHQKVKRKEGISEFAKAQIIFLNYSLIMDYHEIITNLFLGSIFPLRKESELINLSKVGIKSILTVCREVKPIYKYDIFEYISLDLDDDSREEIFDYLEDSCKWIDERLKRRKAIYVHCHMGISRSATIVCAYLMYAFGWSRDKSLEYIRSKRKIIKPNSGFMNQLLQFEQYLQDKRNDP